MSFFHGLLWFLYSFYMLTFPYLVTCSLTTITSNNVCYEKKTLLINVLAPVRKLTLPGLFKYEGGDSQYLKYTQQTL